MVIITLYFTETKHNESNKISFFGFNAPFTEVWPLLCFQCTRPCNGGVQFRKVICLGGESCEGVKPESERPCNEHVCRRDFTESISQNNNNNYNAVHEGMSGNRDLNRLSLPAPSNFNYIKPDYAADISIAHKYNDINEKNIIIGSSSDGTESSSTKNDEKADNDNVDNTTMKGLMPGFNDIIEGGTHERQNTKIVSTGYSNRGIYEWSYNNWLKVIMKVFQFCKLLLIFNSFDEFSDNFKLFTIQWWSIRYLIIIFIKILVNVFIFNNLFI